MKNIYILLLSTFIAGFMMACGRAVPSDNDTNIEPAAVYDDSTTIIVSEDSMPVANEIGDAVDQTTRSRALVGAAAATAKATSKRPTEKQKSLPAHPETNLVPTDSTDIGSAANLGNAGSADSISQPDADNRVHVPTALPDSIPVPD